MPRTEARESSRRTFWMTWQVFVGVPGIFLIGWLLLAPEGLALSGWQPLGAWLAIFAVATIAGLIRAKSRK